MSYNNYITMQFPSMIINSNVARRMVASFVEQLDPTLEELENVRTAVGEAVDNAIVHAYPDAVGVITVRCRILKDNIVDITVKDKGVGIENIERAKMPMFSTDCHRSGMGFTIMDNFMTYFKVISEVGKGTTVHMKKRIISRRSGINV